METLAGLGLRYAVISPGSRSAPLALAFANNPKVTATPVLDERSAAFFALGIARRTRTPVAVIATSGSAGAHFFPAVIEAYESGVPVLLFTADRPPEMRDCQSGQTTDQQKLFGRFPRWQTELLLPEASKTIFRHLRQTLAYAWEISLGPAPGPVHLNIPFREPLAPTEDESAKTWERSGEIAALLKRVPPVLPGRCWLSRDERYAFLSYWKKSENGLIVAGPAQTFDAHGYCRAVGRLAKTLGWPVLSDGLSPLRSFHESVPGLVSRYDFILRTKSGRESLRPQNVIQLGSLPTSKTLRDWLGHCAADTFIIDPGDRNLDPLHGATQYLRTRIEDFVASIELADKPFSAYLARWLDVERRALDLTGKVIANEERLFEGKLAWLASRHLPRDTPCFIASSMPVRDVEAFWEPGNRHVRPYCNRGVNGIDGTLSTALGVCHDNRPGVLITGDLALLHDGNGFLSRPHFRGGLTVFLINNRGGGIFEKLPIAGFDPPFEDFFATPQQVDFAKLAETYGVEYRKIGSWKEVTAAMDDLCADGIRLLEIPADRKADTAFRDKLVAGIVRELEVSGDPWRGGA